MISPIAEATLKAVAYADVFDYPLNTEEIKRYLVGYSEERRAEKALSQLVAAGELVRVSGYYCFPGREGIIKLRQKRRRYSRPKLQKAERIASALRWIPWIKLIGVTGALAMENGDAGDDIDLMVITSAKRLWLTRGLLVTFLRLTGQYRRPAKVKDTICPNLLLGEDALEFKERDLFTAHEIVQMRPIFERGNAYQKFLAANQWAGKFLPNAIESSKVKILVQRTIGLWPKSANPHLKAQNFLLNFFEKLAYKLQLKYMEGKKTVEVTTPSVIRFHPQDARARVLNKYQKRVARLPKLGGKYARIGLRISNE